MTKAIIGRKIGIHRNKKLGILLILRVIGKLPEAFAVQRLPVKLVEKPDPLGKP